MSLIVPPWYFANSTDSLPATPATTIGTNFNAGASNADGTAVSVVSTALSHDVHYLVIGVGGLAVAATDTGSLMDVLVDPAGGTSWASLIDDLVIGATIVTGVTQPYARFYYFPLWIASGSTLGVRARNASAGEITTGRVTYWCYGEPSRPDMWWCGQKVESLGINAASSSGTTVTPGDTGSFGSWTAIGTSTARYGAVQFGTNRVDTVTTNMAYHWEIGYSSVKLPGSPTFYTATNGGEQNLSSTHGPIFCDIASGTAMQARGKASGTAEATDVAIYGVY